MKFGIVEVGSTNTKVYIYDNGALINLGSKYIGFKNNYKKSGHLLESDIKEEVPTIYAFGTSIFRKLEEQE